MIGTNGRAGVTEVVDESAAPAEAGGRSSILRRWVGPTTLGVIGVAGLVGSMQLGLGTTAEPGPGMWPAVTSSLIIISALVMGPQPETEAIHPADAARVGGALALLALFITLFTYTGVFIPSLVVLALWLRFLAARSLVFSVTTALVAAGGLYLVFGAFFGIGG